MMRFLRRLRPRRRGDDRGDGKADFSTAGITLSVGGILSAVVINATTGTGPLTEQTGGVQNSSYGGGAAVYGECDQADASRADGFENGQIPTDVLCELHQPGHYLRADAAVDFLLLNEAYQEDLGKEICVTDAYRPLADQQRLWEAYQNGTGNLAARPGTSNHGLGLAVDLCGGINNFGTSEHEWMRENSQRFGWIHPHWAQQGQPGEEAWHWEYKGSVTEA
ncbi:MAG: M15 family metallopeptidase [Nocardiopsaceae bacterium]|nr:M15 family metallopeptidase [Nocardiopsaceae bacterium]